MYRVALNTALLRHRKSRARAHEGADPETLAAGATEPDQPNPDLLADWFRGMSLVAAGGSDVARDNALVARGALRAERWALLLWLLVAAIALLGVTQPALR